MHKMAKNIVRNESLLDFLPPFLGIHSEFLENFQCRSYMKNRSWQLYSNTHMGFLSLLNRKASINTLSKSEKTLPD